MLGIFMHCVKYTIIAGVVLVLSQIPVRQKRICDHVAELMHSPNIRHPIQWIAEEFDFIEGQGVARSRVLDAFRAEEAKDALATAKESSHAGNKSRAAGKKDDDNSSADVSDESILSGLLKRKPGQSD